MSDKSFVHLHVHNEYSMLDGAAKIDDALDTVARMGQPALATTNHGYQYDAYEFWQKATARGINPIIGVEAYLAPTSRLTAKATPLKGVESTASPYTHMTLLSENNEGLRNLFTLSSRASIEGYFRKPRMDRELLSQYGKGIIATSGCLGSEVNQLLLAGRKDLALEAAGEFQDIFGKENFFFEIMSHGIKEEERIFSDQLDIARALGAPLLATNDSHYTSPDQAHAHDALLCLQTGARLADKNRFRFDGEGYHIKSSEEMRSLWSEFPEACDNTLLVAERCKVTFEPRDDLFPHFPIPEGYTEETYLAEKTWEGIRARYGENPTREVIERTEYELGIINSKGFAGYFLVVSDFVLWAKGNGIKVGPGRGSAAGSIVAYTMRCTELDPILHKLMFERFLNPERSAMPDMDIDFDDNRRGEVIEYVRRKYGSDKVAQIVTYGTIKAKQAIKDSARVLDKPVQLGDRLSKLMPEPEKGNPADLSVVVNPDDPRYREGADVRAEMDANRDAKEVIDLALGLEGLKRQVGLHAAGIIISGQPLIDVLPVSLDRNTGSLVTQFDYPTCESLGLLKMDFLGLKNLSIIDSALKNIKQTTGEDIDLESLPLDDKKTFELFASGNTLGVFQVDSEGMQKLLRRMKPTVFNDISAVLALYRPGPMGIGAHNQYADRKNKREKVDYIHPELAEAIGPILEDTYGLCLPGWSPVYDASEGRNVPIMNLSPGRSLTPSLNLETGQVENKLVTGLKFTGKKRVFEVHTSTGPSLVASATHPVLTPDGWVEVGDLKPGDSIRRNTAPFERVGYELDVESAYRDGLALDYRGMAYLSGVEYYAFLAGVVDSAFSVFESEVQGGFLWLPVGEVGELDSLITVLERSGVAYMVADEFILIGAFDFNNLLAPYSSLVGPLPGDFPPSTPWATVVTIVDKGEEDCYDIEVEDNHNFFVSGLCVHNCIFQEQVMEIAQRLAGYSLGEADLLRKAMGKKKPEVLAELEPEFRARVVANGYSDEAFQALWDVLLPFADYAFNRAHTASYGLISYWTGWLKAHYPAEYMASLLDSATTDSLPYYLAEAERMGIEILPPDVASSSFTYTPLEGGKIRYGLGQIRNLGVKPVQKIEKERSERPFASLSDFLERTGVTIQVASSLVQAGALDRFSGSRSGMFEALEELVPIAHARFKENQLGNVDIFEMLRGVTGESPIDPDFGEEQWSHSTKLQKEFHVTGMYLSGSPLEGYREAIGRYAHIKKPGDLGVFEPGSVVVVGGILKGLERRVAKRSGRPWVSTNILFDGGSLGARAFGRLVANDSPKLGLFREDNVVLLKCRMELDGDSGEPTLLIQDIVACKKDSELAPLKTLLVSPSAEGFTVRSFELFKRVMVRFPGGFRVHMRSPMSGVVVDTGLLGDGSASMKLALKSIFGEGCSFEVLG